MIGRIETASLHRMCYNSLLYRSPTTATKGATLWIKGATTLRVVSTDEYVVVVDQSEIIGGDGAEWLTMDQGSLQALEKALRASESSSFDLSELKGTPDLVEVSELLGGLDTLVFETDALEPLPLANFALHPDRLRKLSLIKPGDYQIDIRGFSDGETDLLGFRCGPTVRGLISPTDRKTLEELYSGEEIWRSDEVFMNDEDFLASFNRKNTDR